MRSVAAAAVLLIVSSTGVSQIATKISALGWMAGCWEKNDEKRGMLITEMWMRPSGNAMMGVGRTIRSGKLIDFENLRIVEDADGLSYISRPSANKEDTAFRMIKSSANEVVFENLTHDFPQRIMYKRSGANMTARIEGTTNGRVKGVDFSYVRVRCD